jgi:hypothetical protein
MSSGMWCAKSNPEEGGSTFLKQFSTKYKSSYLEDSNLLSSFILQMKLLGISDFMTFFGMFIFPLITIVNVFYNYQGRYCRPAGIRALFYGTVPWQTSDITGICNILLNKRNLK